MGFADIGLSINKRIAIFWEKDKATAGCLCFITVCIIIGNREVFL